MLLGAAAVASALRLEVDDTVQAFVQETVPIRGVENVLDDVEPGKAQTILVLGSDKRYKRQGAAGRRAVGHDDAHPPGPGEGRDGGHVDPARPQGEIPGHGTDKINAAYSIGGPKLAVQTVRQLLDIPINHVVNVNFGGFSRAVKRLGCFYIDVDRRYFNDNNPPAGGGGAATRRSTSSPATSGCAASTRSTTSASATSTTTSSAPPASRATSSRPSRRSASAGCSATARSSCGSSAATRRPTSTPRRRSCASCALTYEATKSPIREVRFPAGIENVHEHVRDDHRREPAQDGPNQFLEAREVLHRRRRAQADDDDPVRRLGHLGEREEEVLEVVAAPRALAPGLVAAKTQGEDMVATMSTKAGQAAGLLPRGPHERRLREQSSNPRLYTIKDRAGYAYQAYRIIGYAGENGQYWGVQGTSWRSPPILDDPGGTIKMRGRTYHEYYDGTRLRLIAWKTKNGSYWVSNTLSRTLTNPQMRDIAKNAHARRHLA